MKNSQKGFVVPLLIIAALLVIGGGMYVYSKQDKKPVSLTRNFTDTTTGPKCTNGATNYPRCNSDLPAYVPSTAPNTRTFLENMQKDLGVKLNYRDSTTSFVVPIRIFDTNGSKELHGYAWDVKDTSESKYIYSKLSKDSLNENQRSTGYKNDSIFCSEQDLHWSCGDIDEIVPYTVRIMPLDISNIDTEGRSFMLKVQGKQFEIVLIGDDSLFRRETTDASLSFNDFIAAINDMKIRGANDPVMIKGSFSGSMFNATEVTWY